MLRVPSEAVHGAKTGEEVRDGIAWAECYCQGERTKAFFGERANAKRERERHTERQKEKERERERE